MGTLALRRATSKDAKAVRVLTRLAYAHWIEVIGREPKPMTADYDLAVRDHLVELYEIDGQILALIELIPAADHLFVENIAVHPDHARTGIGSVLLAHAEQFASKTGAREVRLLTNAAFSSNVQFYAKRGYIIHNRTRAPETGETVHMVKRIQLSPTLGQNSYD